MVRLGSACMMEYEALLHVCRIVIASQWLNCNLPLLMASQDPVALRFLMAVLPQVLVAIRGTAEVEAELAEIRKAAGDAKASSGGLVLFRHRRHLPQLLWCIVMPIMQQYTGINAFMFYGERSLNACTVLCSRLLHLHRIREPSAPCCAMQWLHNINLVRCLPER